MSAAMLMAAALAATAPVHAPERAGLMVRLAEVEIDPARIDAYKALLAEEVEASVRLEPGVLMLHAVAIDGMPSHIRLLEVYASRSAYEAHITSPQFVTYKTLTAPMVISLKLVPTKPITLCAKADMTARGRAHCM